MKKFFYTNYLGFSPIISYELLHNSNVDMDINSSNSNDENIQKIDENCIVQSYSLPQIIYRILVYQDY